MNRRESQAMAGFLGWLLGLLLLALALLAAGERVR